MQLLRNSKTLNPWDWTFMKAKNNIFLIAGAIVILGILLLLAYGKTGKGAGHEPEPVAAAVAQTVPAEPEPEASSEGWILPEEMQRANRSLFDNLGLEGRTIYVIGHKSPDTDTVGSAIAYAKLLNALGYRAEPRIASEKINNETKYVLNLCGLETPPYLENAAGQAIFMVDHNELMQAAPGMEDAEIVGILDHHTINTSMEAIIKVRSEHVGATATLIAMDYELYGVEIDPVTAKLLACTILSDTENFKKDTTTYGDRVVYEKLAKLGNLTDPDIYQKMKTAKESYEGMTDTDIYFSDYKEYTVNGITYAIPTLRADNAQLAVNLGRRMKPIMAKQYATGSYGFIFTKIKDDRLDTAYLFVCGDGAEEVCRQAFPNCSFHGEYLTVKPSISRKSVMVPAINSVLGTSHSKAA